MQTATTSIARRLNTLSVGQQQAVRVVVETLIQFGLDESITDILKQTSFMNDLVILSDEDNNDLIDDEAEESGESSDDSGEDLDSNKENSSGYSDMEISDEEVTKAGLNRA
ncbi:hypothetical protein VNI00_016993 [Paramarasmius palmivorus]|uniref:Uncharacterized protein n=1 Tax=Paramarasmius palmivorus TaxID=297713 RepID=A0AAW0BCY4_9AGAR